MVRALTAAPKRPAFEPPNMAVTSGKPNMASDEARTACRNSCNNR